MSLIDSDWLKSAATQSVFSLLQEGGYQAWAVGGCVRDALLGVEASDVDFTTDAPPDKVIKLARNRAMKAIPTGIEHGTVTLVSEGCAFEVTTFRRDVMTDGRHATVAFATTISEDACRRDFTMNALYAGRDGAVMDPLGGMKDLRAHHVRFIGDPTERIREDYLRILRFFRFQAWFGAPSEGIDAEALSACARLSDGMKTLSKERIGSEMRKLLSAPNPAPSIASMASAGVLARVLPGAAPSVLAVLVHLEETAEASPDWLCRLAALGESEVKENLRLGKADAKRWRLMRGEIGTTTSLAELAYRHGADAATNIALLRAASLGQTLAKGILDIIHHAAAQVFPVHAHDLTPAFQGAALGAELRRLEKKWITSGFLLDRETLLA